MCLSKYNCVSIREHLLQTNTISKTAPGTAKSCSHFDISIEHIEQRCFENILPDFNGKLIF